MEGILGSSPLATGGDACDSEHLAMISGIVVQNNIFDAPSYSMTTTASPGRLSMSPFHTIFGMATDKDGMAVVPGPYSSAGVNFHFVSPGYPDYNYAIQAGSTACHFIPTSQPHPATDINGNPRTDDGTALIDAGAFGATSC